MFLVVFFLRQCSFVSLHMYVLIFLNFRPHCSTTYIGQMRPIVTNRVVWSVGLSVTLTIHAISTPCCAQQNSQFGRSGTLYSHVRVHMGTKPYKCDVCDNAFIKIGNLKQHMRVHTGDKPFQCSMCSKTFSQSCNLQMHKRRLHSNRRLYQCPYCGMQFKTSIQLKQHVHVHTDAKSYSCRHCSDHFRWHYQLKQHLLKSHNEGTWFTCDVCELSLIHI